MSCMTFSHQHPFVNLSRVDPDLLSVVNKTPFAKTSQRLQLTIGGRTAICLTPVYTVASSLLKLNAVQQKGLCGILHSQEYERFVGVMRMAFNHTNLRAAAFNTGISFATLTKKGQIFTPSVDDANTLTRYFTYSRGRSAVRFPEEG